MPQRALLAAAAALLFGFLAPAQAHRDGCHRWHSCPSDSGSYVCGDLGYTSGCPTAQAPVRTVVRAAAPPTSGATRRTTTSLNLRAGPSTTSAKLATLTNGTTVGLIGCGNGWCQVKWQGQKGYVSQQYLK
ncbi:SH3 domain-containing protein [Deinococcus sp. QL22]|uniref:SH3 domain-containing protein n=1 Tax=Deinococcus sp. QL22 TaxID=2939437 RepID=UPI002017D927|nr:SH3 domain-containing protein [Deinococcus sp. QL22]UQN10240.1 SH3 domain-containing protein [Deinococcus sp. QL22]